MDQPRSEKLHNTEPWIEALTHTGPRALKPKIKVAAFFSPVLLAMFYII
jgi:hypothetical protein